jgi:hypothetical protein
MHTRERDVFLSVILPENGTENEYLQATAKGIKEHRLLAWMSSSHLTQFVMVLLA